jgi:ABC-2 type transport system permease protein
MRNALVAEYRKVFSTRLWWILLLCLAGYLALIAAGLSFVVTSEPTADAEFVPVVGADAAISVYSVINGIGYVFPLVVGSLAMTTEFRHKTITQSLLVEPRRSVFLAAKLLAGVPLGLLYGLAAAAAVVLGGAPLLAFRGDGAYLGDGDVIVALLSGVLVTTLWAVIGVAFGSLVTNQVAAIVVILAITQFVEPILRSVSTAVDGLAGVGQYLPGAAADAVIGGSFLAGFGGGEVDLLPRWGGLLVLLAYAGVLALVGRITTLRRDLA